MEWVKSEISGVLIDHGFLPLAAGDDEQTVLLKIFICMKYLSTELTEYEIGDDK